MRLTKRARSILAVLIVGAAFWGAMAVALAVGEHWVKPYCGPRPSGNVQCVANPQQDGTGRWVSK